MVFLILLKARMHFIMKIFLLTLTLANRLNDTVIAEVIVWISPQKLLSIQSESGYGVMMTFINIEMFFTLRHISISGIDAISCIQIIISSILKTWIGKIVSGKQVIEWGKY